ncbi:MAG: hypothetical protein KDA28_04905, partial [Phycisphaerales bacterium]|nr:hypothetical protein [Phycisphaerales bacterium]
RLVRDEATTTSSDTTLAIKDAEQSLFTTPKGLLLLELEALVRRAETTSSRPALPPPKPVLQVVQSLTRVLGFKEVQLNRFQVTKAAVTVEITVPDIEWAEGLFKALEGEDQYIDWREPSFTTRGSVVVGTFTALWRDLDG